MEPLVKVNSEKDIFDQYRNTPIEKLIRFHNFGEKFENYEKAELFVGMCMDNRKQLNIPNNFAYIIRTGGGNLRYSEFKISYSVAIGGVNAVVLIAHNNCGMVNLMSQKEQFIDGLVKTGGWERKDAHEHFLSYAPMFEIENEIYFVLREVERLRSRYKSVLFAPLFYNLDDNLLYLLNE